MANDNDDYVTVVMLHGFVWHAGTFKRMIPFAKKYNARLILVNRRDYPGSTPFTEEELNQLASTVSGTPQAIESLRSFVRDRAMDLYQLLETLIKVDNIPQRGGIVVGGWSFGTQFTTALLAHAGSFPVGEINVASYIRHVVNLDMPSHFLGYAAKEGCWNPLLDSTLPEGEGLKIFPRWVSGYFLHGETVADLVPRDFTPDIPPTLDRMTPEDLQSALYVVPGLPGASDNVLSRAVMTLKISSEIKHAAVFPPGSGDWDKLELHHIFGDRSSWSEFWGAECLREEIAKEQKLGRRARPVEIVRLRGANHFSAWDYPERTLVAILGVESEAQ